jgi:hypothetical protein
MNIVAGLSGLKAAADLTRTLRDVAKAGQLKPDELAGRIGEIYDYIVDSKDALTDAKDEIQQLKSKLKALDDRRKTDSELQHDGYVFWRKHPDGSQTGPYCPFCWTKEDKLVPLTHIPGEFGEYRSKQYRCTAHNSVLVPTLSQPEGRKPRAGKLDTSVGWMGR